MKTFFLSTISILMSITVSAQYSEIDIEKAKANIEEQFESLNLNDDQKTQFKEINEKYRLKLESIRNSNKTRLAKFQILQTLSKEKDAEMKLLFNEDQFKIYKTYQKQSRDKRRAAFKMRNNN